MKIGVFDSGMGGQSIADALAVALPAHEIVFKNDVRHVPYGNRPAAELAALVFPIISQMVQDGCGLIVIACNTVSVTLSGELRASFGVPFVVLDPMLKPAAQLTKSGVIAVCATPTTLGSQRYAALKHEFAATITVLEPDCSDWAGMIEAQKLERRHIAERIGSVLDQGADVIVLACTHYHWIEAEISQLARGRAQVLQPTDAIIRRVQQLLA